MKSKLLFSLLAAMMMSLSVNAQDHIELSSYSGQSEITASGSITLKPGFHIPAGQTVRIYISASGSSCDPLASAPSTNQNYIRTNTYRTPFSMPPSAPGTCDVMQEITYLDGLGRPVQAVTTKGSPTFKDVVQPIEYDAFGRAAKKYLPYTTTGTPGAFKTNAITAQGSFYSSPPAGVGNSNYPYSQTIFEPSPLNRVIDQGAPGNSWQPASGSIPNSGHTVRTEYLTNNETLFSTLSSTRRVALYGVSLAGDGTPTLTVDGAYGAGELYVRLTKDENWKSSDGRVGTTEEYTDKQGRIVLKRSFNLNETGNLEMLSTYYVYDDFGNLTYVLPPGRAAVFSPDAASVPTADNLDKFCYQYRYDERNRMIEKKLPGKEREYLIYNKLDQVVLTQDGVQQEKSPKEWTFTKYDGLGRVVISGRYQSNTPPGDLQTLVNSHVTLWEERDPANNGIGATGYSNAAFPQSGIVEYYQINFYDDYAFPADCPVSLKTAGSGHSRMTRGLLTATKTKVLGGSTFLWAVNFYDHKGRTLETRSQHHHGGTDVVTTEYNFTGQPLTVTRLHKKGTATTTLAERYEYDHQGRLTNTYHRVNTQPEVLLSTSSYTETGALLSKQLHSEDQGASYLQKVDYAYNVRGWLRSINDADLVSADNDLFGMEFNYRDNELEIDLYPGQFNGSIAEMIWNSDRQNKRRGYAFEYDRMNRLHTASYREYGSDWTSDPSNKRYSESDIRYDKMGNIVHFKRHGYTGSSAVTVMDDLLYDYSGNQLVKVNEHSTGTPDYGFKEAPYISGWEYDYDANGNMKTDENKGITNIGYNYLNLPEAVTIGGTTVNYRYRSDGTKIQKTSGSEVTHYIGGIHYDGNTLDFIQTSEGRILRSPATGQYSYEYYLTDHLGNVRVSFGKDPVNGAAVVIQENNYYAFGGTFDSYVASTENHYLYNGKEEQKEWGVYDYGARFYDPVIGRWGVVDPLAENHYNVTAYHYTLNNPLLYIDPLGLDTLKYAEFLKDPSKVVAGDVIDLGEGGYTEVLEEVAVTAPREYNILKMPSREPYTGFWGNLEYFLYGGIEDGINYNRQGEPTGLAPIMGMPPAVGKYTSLKSMLRSIKSLGKLFKAAKGSNWVYGGFKSSTKWASQLAKRGWTEKQITEAITKGKSFPAVNNVNKANSATRYVHPQTGQSVVIDDVTKELLHVGGQGFKY